MRQRGTAVLLFLFVPLSPVPAQSLELMLRASSGIEAAWDQRFSPGAQLQFGAGARLQALGVGGFGGGFGVGYDGARPSPVVDLVSYRGWGGLAVELFGAWRSSIGGGTFAVDLRAGVRVSILSYVPAPIYFVVPALFVEPALSVRLPPLPAVALGAGLPFVFSRRADLRLSASVSLSVSVGVRIERGRRGE